MKKNLLFIPCRHHIHEIITSGVFEKLFGQSTGPNMEMFGKFKKQWHKTKRNSRLFQKQFLNLNSQSNLKALRFPCYKEY